MLVIPRQYTHRLVCEFGIQWYRSPGRVWPRRSFQQCRCAKPGEAHSTESSITIRSNNMQCLDFPKWFAEHQADPATAIANTQPLPDLNQLADPVSDDDSPNGQPQDHWLEIKDKTTSEAIRSSETSVEWKHVNEEHKLIACASAPAESDVQLTIGLYSSETA